MATYMSFILTKDKYLYSYQNLIGIYVCQMNDSKHVTSHQNIK